MAVATFDTLKFANTLKAAGVPPQQAEAQAVAFAEVIQLNFKELVTKDDLAATAKETRGEISDAKKELKHELKDVEQRLSGRIDVLAGRFGTLAAKFETLTAKTETTATKIDGAVTLLRWVVGLNATVVFGVGGLALRYFIIRGLP